ncbi:MarR family winged helix-turn-helix transcriptional regulator [Parasporobacterium paucivorans]|nr:MarR family transcriptional regulator [Parasporobacterium paucivorans]
MRNTHFEILHSFRKLNISSLMPNITHCEFGTLKTIKQCSWENMDKGVRICMLAERLDVAAPAVSRTIRSLEQKEFVIRAIDENDRRNVFVELTAEGEEMLMQMENIMEDFSSAVMDKVGSENMEKLNYHLKQLYEVSKEELELRKNNDRKENTDNGQNI